MKRWLLLLSASITLLSLTLFPQVANNTSQALRQTLAKIVFASQISTITQLGHTTRNHETALELRQALTNAALEFTVNNVSGGSAGSIQDQKLIDFMTGLQIIGHSKLLASSAVAPSLPCPNQRAKVTTLKTERRL